MKELNALYQDLINNLKEQNERDYILNTLQMVCDPVDFRDAELDYHSNSTIRIITNWIIAEGISIEKALKRINQRE